MGGFYQVVDAPLAPVTPEKTTRKEDVLDSSASTPIGLCSPTEPCTKEKVHKDNQQNSANTSKGPCASAEQQNNKRQVDDSQQSLTEILVKERISTDKAHVDGVDLNRTPAQKPKRKKVRAKVVREVKPRKTPNKEQASQRPEGTPVYRRRLTSTGRRKHKDATITTLDLEESVCLPSAARVSSRRRSLNFDPDGEGWNDKFGSIHQHAVERGMPTAGNPTEPAVFDLNGSLNNILASRLPLSENSSPSLLKRKASSRWNSKNMARKKGSSWEVGNVTTETSNKEVLSQSGSTLEKQNATERSSLVHRETSLKQSKEQQSHINQCYPGGKRFNFQNLQECNDMLVHIQVKARRSPRKASTRTRHPRTLAISHGLMPQSSTQEGEDNMVCGPQTCQEALLTDTLYQKTTKKRRMKRISHAVKSAPCTTVDRPETCTPQGQESQGVLSSSLVNKHDTMAIRAKYSVHDCQSSRNLKENLTPMFSSEVISFMKPTDEMVNRLRSLDIREKDGNAAAVLQNEIVSYSAEGTIVPYAGTFKPLIKRRPRPKVDLDEETNIAWKLLMGIESAGMDGTDADKEKWWEEQRRVFRGRADSFIARMHLIQGDRRFSQWKGSVVDSIVGVFLTQNVSDHLSSSAFMALAARFPLNEERETARLGNKKISTFPPVQQFPTRDLDETMVNLNNLPLRKSTELDHSSIGCRDEATNTDLQFKSSHEGQCWMVKGNLHSSSKVRETVDVDSSEHTKQVENQKPESKLGTVSKDEAVKHGNKPRKKVFRSNKGKGEALSTKKTWDPLRRQLMEKFGLKERAAEKKDSLDWEAVRHADVSEVAQAIKERGMNNKLAARIQEFLNRLVEDHDSIDLEWLRDIPPDKAKDFLLSINGLGLKSVECVRLLSLQQLAFPVDTNVGRICVRLGWVPLQPLPESLQLHLLELYPVLESVQKYLWPRLCKLDQRTLYELHYQLITFGKVFCTKSRPNCNACPMRGECKHFASAFASARLSLPAPEEISSASSSLPLRDEQGTSEARIHQVALPPPVGLPPAIEGPLLQKDSGISKCEPIIEEPATPEPESVESSESAIEDFNCDDPDEIPTIKLNLVEFPLQLKDYIQEKDIKLQDTEVSKALVALTPEAASIPTPKLKNMSRLRTEHLVYELPDDHPLLEGLDKREPDDPCFYLLAIWTPGETAESIEPPKACCDFQPSGNLCHKQTCFSCNAVRETTAQTVRGTLLIPCRTAMRGSFPLNGTYFQVNEVFADHESSFNPIDVPTALIWNLRRRIVYFGTSVTTIFRGMTTEEIQYCFWRGFVCVRGFDLKTRAPRPLVARIHIPASKQTRNKKTTARKSDE